MADRKASSGTGAAVSVLPEKIVLVGMMGAGKSTIGKLLAERIGYTFVDLDAEVERYEGRSVARIFAEDGERAFRQMEAAVAERHDAATGTVLAVGGGWMARPELRDRWPDSVRVWLRVSLEQAWERIGSDVTARPMLDPDRPRESLAHLLEDRAAAYERAEISVESGVSAPEEVAGLVVELLRMQARGRPTSSTGTGS